MAVFLRLLCGLVAIAFAGSTQLSAQSILTYRFSSGEEYPYSTSASRYLSGEVCAGCRAGGARNSIDGMFTIAMDYDRGIASLLEIRGVFVDTQFLIYAQDVAEPYPLSTEWVSTPISPYDFSLEDVLRNGWAGTVSTDEEEILIVNTPVPGLFQPPRSYWIEMSGQEAVLTLLTPTVEIIALKATQLVPAPNGIQLIAFAGTLVSLRRSSNRRDLLASTGG